MSKPPRAPLQFSVTETPAAAVAAAPRPANDSTERQQVGARVTKTTYRQLKAHAALQGLTVQTLVEKAIAEYLEKHN